MKTRLSNRSRVQSSHTGELDIRELPARAYAHHSVPGLLSHSLTSVVKRCKVGVKVTFTEFGTGVEVRYRNRLIWIGHKCTQPHLWMVPLKAPTLSILDPDLTIGTPPPTLLTLTTPARVNPSHTASLAATSRSRFNQHFSYKQVAFSLLSVWGPGNTSTQDNVLPLRPRHQSTQNYTSFPLRYRSPYWSLAAKPKSDLDGLLLFWQVLLIQVLAICHRRCHI